MGFITEHSPSSTDVDGGSGTVSTGVLPRATEPQLHDGYPVDAHVHFHECFSLSRFLDAASANFATVASRCPSRSDVAGCMMLAEIEPGHPLDRIRSAAAASRTPWSCESCAEEESLIACRNGEAQLVVIAGRQLVTREGLEVLALGTTRTFTTRRTLSEAVQEIRDREAIPVLPWGFGKWWFRRGRVVAELLDTLGVGPPRERPDFFLGDNGGRPAAAPPPKPFRIVRGQGIRLLPGSDPFPLPSHETKPGSYGFLLPGRLDLERPLACVKTCLHATDEQPPVFGRRDTIARFCRTQCAYRIRRRRA